MMLFTTWAVIRREWFDQPILGVVDIMELALVICVFLAIAAVFLRDDNVTVDVIDRLVSATNVARLRVLAWLVSLLVMAASMIEMVPAAMEKFGSGEVTMTLSIDRFLHWVPILTGFATAVLACLWLLAGASRGRNHSDNHNPRP